jgi:SAM-dependent methyltransferase
MALDLTRLVSQVGEMVSRLRTDARERHERLDRARQALADHAGSAEALERKIAASRTTWLVAGIVDGLDGRYQPAPLPGDFTVVASDGSHIDVDRHRSTRCYLVNIGSVVLRYGTAPDAVLESLPRLYAGDEDLVIADENAPGREQPVEGALLGIKRGVEECRRLAELGDDLPAGLPALALVDGTLLLWGLEAFPEFVMEELLERGYLKHLERLRQRSLSANLALASYISYPRSTDVVNALKVAVCPRETVDSDRCPSCETRECDAIARVRDRELFAELLQPGERSDVFISSSKIQKRYGPHQVYFCYLRVDDEIARLEVPRWVATDRDRLDLAHALVLDQCRRGHGYPVALSEAHEKAVVTGADAENFWRLVELQLVEERLPLAGSAKSRSKRTRWL